MENNNLNDKSFKTIYDSREITLSGAEDFIEPRIVVSKDITILAGAPQIGKSDFLTCWMMHMAAGLPFMGMNPRRALRVLYLHSGIDFFVLRERLRSLTLHNKKFSNIHSNIAFILPTSINLSKPEIEDIDKRSKEHFKDNKVDIIVIDSWSYEGINISKEHNDNMIDFLDNKLEELRKRINPNAGIILTHNFDDDIGAMIGGGDGNVFNIYTRIIMSYPDSEKLCRQLIFEHFDEYGLPVKTIAKVDDCWHELTGGNDYVKVE